MAGAESWKIKMWKRKGAGEGAGQEHQDLALYIPMTLDLVLSVLEATGRF